MLSHCLVILPITAFPTATMFNLTRSGCMTLSHSCAVAKLRPASYFIQVQGIHYPDNNPPAQIEPSQVVLLFMKNYKPNKSYSFFNFPYNCLASDETPLIKSSPSAFLFHYNQSVCPGFKYRHPHRPLIKLYSRIASRVQHRAAEIAPGI